MNSVPQNIDQLTLILNKNIDEENFKEMEDLRKQRELELQK